MAGTAYLWHERPWLRPAVGDVWVVVPVGEDPFRRVELAVTVTGVREGWIQFEAFEQLETARREDFVRQARRLTRKPE
jgi:hypothetical protein